MSQRYFANHYFPSEYFPEDYFGPEINPDIVCSIPNYRRMPHWMVEKLLEEYEEHVAYPSGVWADFNCLHRAYRVITYAILNDEIFCPEDLPIEPDPNDYPDIDSPTTITNCGLAAFQNFEPGFDGLEAFYSGTVDNSYNDGVGYNSPYDIIQ